MKANRVTLPFYGTYQSPEGRLFELRSPGQVYEVFRGLLKRMPQFRHWGVRPPTVVSSKREPGKRFFVQPSGEMVPAGVREGVGA